MLIQIILSLFVIFALIKTTQKFKSKEISLIALFFWVLFWLVVVLVVWRPGLSTELANFLGVGRGADLLFYFSIALLFYLIFRMTVKMEKMERNITKIVREISLGQGAKDK
ncbi:MAG: hypothetical protein UT86_C0001G0059 [Candidatus Magasanikbacteria bacterium GW2011_GWC2_40_17]|uniref:DUF2304 domain-containing protein n=1 Tax=Candidatus Magasanikbacteria bacterium GW2011_GWA2_42_32 TaxID=1619039 RepID=A0A0G1A901_9BACT|nr:MAG: hypothetical protein UT86_C0001G0059 [Candidatus Magasanikbacteria bacterium GW2011_GWC2_40_17]KKS57419.1 MAG: hypothetical protein UV20_C0001G0059 [Candidatus Magasanikbacteria bacterium GW2011_GWA2_42_32]OGH85587.1 MAG: hypothetical protein A2294_01770 [Candidatus Magasanikbacteria bacterium RIFOXYB2_FULL_38_10]